MKKISLTLFSALTLAAQYSTAETISKQDDVSVIAYTIYAEARGEGQRGMHLVASVIYNRSIERGISAKDVCLQKSQFSCWNGVSSPSVSIKAEQDLKAWKFAINISNDIQSKTFKPSTTANHYYNPSIANPSWGSKMKDVIVYKRHKFGRL